jgi:hypothetical protein
MMIADSMHPHHDAGGAFCALCQGALRTPCRVQAERSEGEGWSVIALCFRAQPLTLALRACSVRRSADGALSPHAGERRTGPTPRPGFVDKFAPVVAVSLSRCGWCERVPTLRGLSAAS